MNGTKQRWLGGTLLTLGLALACASVGCVTPDDPDSDTDDAAEQVGAASQELDELEAPPPEDGEEETGAPGVDEGAVDDGEDGEPQPVPWRVYLGSPLPDDPGPIDPMGTPQVSTPSSGHGK